MQITRGAATEEELAALIAVVSDAYAQEASEAVADEPRVSAWARTCLLYTSPSPRDS